MSELPSNIAALFDGGDYAGGATDTLIEEVERTYGIEFPAQYREFLKTYGAILLPGLEIYGLVPRGPEDTAPYWCDIRSVLGSSYIKRLPSRLVPISDDGVDTKFYLEEEDCSTDPARARVIAYGPGLDGKVVAESFFEFCVAARQRGVPSLVAALVQQDPLGSGTQSTHRG